MRGKAEALVNKMLEMHHVVFTTVLLLSADSYAIAEPGFRLFM